MFELVPRSDYSPDDITITQKGLSDPEDPNKCTTFEVSKTKGAGGWNASAISKNSIIGDCTLTFRGVNSQYLMAGITTDPTANNSYNTIDYAWYLPGGTSLIYENGSSKGSFLAFNSSTIFKISYDSISREVSYIMDDKLMRKVSHSGTNEFYFDSSFHNVGGEIYDVEFRAGRAGDQGQIGQKGATGEKGIKGIKGEIGPVGNSPKGDFGQKGSKGEIGPGGDSPKGDAGQKGSKGEIGPVGDSPKGDVGQKGIKGEIGPVGAKGPVGKDNRMFTLQRSGTGAYVDPVGDFDGVSSTIWEASKFEGTDYSWSASARSVEGITGDCTVTFWGSFYQYIMAGLTTDPKANDSYNTIDYAWYLRDVAHIYENGSHKGAMGSYTTSTKFTVSYNSAAGIITYLLDGALVRNVSAGVGLTMYFDSSFYRNGGALYDIEFRAGYIGPTGPKGQTGGTGFSGPFGDKGPVGASPKGPVGDKGPIGSKGPVGDSPRGPVGDKGPIGSKGPVGDSPRGPVGDKGPVGDTGRGGLTGPSGASGGTGSGGGWGAKGQKGEAGAFGPPGPSDGCDTQEYEVMCESWSGCFISYRDATCTWVYESLGYFEMGYYCADRTPMFSSGYGSIWPTGESFACLTFAPRE